MAIMGLDIGTTGAKSPDGVKSVAMSQLGEAGIPLDKNLQPLANSIIGFDTRGDQECREFRDKADEREVFNITGHPINSFHSLFKILYLKRHEPAVFSRMHKFLCYEDFVTLQLGLEPTINYALAARTLLLDVHRGCWSERLFDMTGLDPAVMAKPAATGTVVCMGILLNRQADPNAMIKANLCRYPTFGGNWIIIAWNFTDGSALKWFRDNFAADLVERTQPDA